MSVPADSNSAEPPGDPLRWTCLACWAMTVMAPIEYWNMGPSVSRDQFVVRTVLLVGSAAAAAVTTFLLWRRSRASVGRTKSGEA